MSIACACYAIDTGSTFRPYFLFFLLLLSYKSDCRVFKTFAGCRVIFLNIVSGKNYHWSQVMPTWLFFTELYFRPFLLFFSFLNMRTFERTKTTELITYKWHGGVLSTILDLLAEKACKQNPWQICDVFVSDWVQFLIHIHDKLWNFSKPRCSWMCEDVSSCWRLMYTLEGRRCLLCKARKYVFSLF